MASSITSRSPHSPYDFDSADDSNESWQYIDYSSGASATASVGFLPSPASGSLSGFAIVGHMSTPSPQAGASSPYGMGEMDQPVFLPSSASYPPRSEPVTSDVFTPAGFVAQDETFMTPQQYLFPPQAEVGEFSQEELNGTFCLELRYKRREKRCAKEIQRWARS